MRQANSFVVAWTLKAASADYEEEYIGHALHFTEDDENPSAVEAKLASKEMDSPRKLNVTDGND